LLPALMDKDGRVEIARLPNGGELEKAPLRERR
jgi:hypothetical protein